ncbi:MAG: hypothetical protein JW894_03165 [Bacteroidales bacterium]|nr:hypothetical protein [Bacteroidales bacterium]
MPQIILSPAEIKAAGNKPKTILEYIGRVNSDSSEISVAQMKSPTGWIESGQKPEFNEYTLVLKGILKVETENETFEVKAGQAIIIEKNCWVRYFTPFQDTEYIAVCLPAFSPQSVHRDK